MKKRFSWWWIVWGLVGVAYVATLPAAFRATLNEIRKIAPKKGTDAQLVRDWRAAGFAFRQEELPRRPVPANNGDPIAKEILAAKRAKRPYLALARRLAESDGYGYRFEKLKDGSPLFLELDGVKLAARRLRQEAVDLAATGRRTEALADVRRLRRLADLSSEMPGTSPSLLAFSNEAMAIRAAADLALLPKSDLAFRRAAREAIGRPLVVDRRRELISEAVITLNILRSEGAAPDGFPKDPKERDVMRWVMRAWLALASRTNGLRDADAIETEVDRAIDGFPRERKTAGDLLPFVTDLPRKRATHRTLLDAVVEGGRPEKKDAWGRPIRWRGPIPYSLGKDGKDNQGGKGDLPLIKIPS